MSHPRLLIEEWLPAAAIGVECMRERGSASALAPHTYLHVWWARRPLTASRAAVLGSLLPADFPRGTFERLLGFWGKSKDILNVKWGTFVLRQLVNTCRLRITQQNLLACSLPMSSLPGNAPPLHRLVKAG